MTSIQAIDVDANDNVALAGRSTDLAIVSNAGNAIMGVLDASGFEYRWLVEFNGLTNQVARKITFSIDSSKVMVLFNPDPMTIIVVDASNGLNILAKLTDSAS